MLEGINIISNVGNISSEGVVGYFCYSTMSNNAFSEKTDSSTYVGGTTTVLMGGLFDLNKFLDSSKNDLVKDKNQYKF